MQVFMRVMLRWLAPHDDFAFRHNQVDADVIEPALAMMAVVCFHDHVAGDDPIEEFLQLVHMLAAPACQPPEFARGKLARASLGRVDLDQVAGRQRASHGWLAGQVSVRKVLESFELVMRVGLSALGRMGINP